jgi:polyisoprenyl-phosphate glycosyltransferase
MTADPPLLSVVTPAHNEAENLPALFERILAAVPTSGLALEWIVVDDHSSDTTFDVVRAIAQADARVRGIRLARRCGAHAAIACGMLDARGDAVALLAADLQDPPDLLIPLAAAWRAGTSVVWAVRRHRRNEPRTAALWSRAYYRLLRTIGGIRDLPAAGAACFLIDRRVVEGVRDSDRRAVDVMALIGSLGFPSSIVPYDRPARLRGTSRWTLRRKLSFALKSLVSVSALAARRASPMQHPIEARVEDPPRRSAETPMAELPRQDPRAERRRGMPTSP